MKSSFYRTEMVYQKSNRRTSMSFQVICALRLQHWQGSFGPSAQEEIYMIIWYELAWGGCSHEILIICNIIFPNLFYWFSLSLSWSLSWVHPIDFQITVRHYKSFIFKLFKDWVPSKSKLQTLIQPKESYPSSGFGRSEMAGMVMWPFSSEHGMLLNTAGI